MLGTAPGDGFISSVRALGLLPVGNFTKKRSGTLILYIIGNCNYQYQVCNVGSFNVALKSPKNVSNSSIQKMDYSERQQVKAGDYIAVYIPEQREEPDAIYPLQVLVSRNKRKSYLKLVRGSGDYGKVSMENLRKMIKTEVEHRGLDEWVQEADC